MRNLDTPIFNTELLNSSQLKYIQFMAKGMAEMWSKIEIVWYSDGHRYFQITGVDGQIYPSVIIDN